MAGEARQTPSAPLPLPGSVLFCCNMNAIRSPLAEAVMKKRHGGRVYVQSAGVQAQTEVDGFTVAVAAEIGLDLSRHRTRSFDDMLAWSEEIDQFDLIVALSPAAQRHALEHTRNAAVEVLFWPVLDPSGLGERREDRLMAYRQTRDQIIRHITETFP